MTTQWNLVLAASQSQAPEHSEALEHLCRAYWYPVYAFVRKRGHGPSDAEDLTQEFFARLLAKEWLSGIEQNGPRFRSFLLTAVVRFLANERDRTTAKKRGGGAALLNLEDAEDRFLLESEEASTREGLFDRHWALTVMDAALRQLEHEAAGAGRSQVFGCLSPFLSREPGPGEYEVVAGQLAMESGGVGVAVYRLRRRYREVVRAMIAETVTDPGLVEDELRYLVEVLRGQP